MSTYYRTVKASERLPGQDQICRLIGCVDLMDSYDFLQAVKFGRANVNEWEWLEPIPFDVDKMREALEEILNDHRRLYGFAEMAVEDYSGRREVVKARAALSADGTIKTKQP